MSTSQTLWTGTFYRVEKRTDWNPAECGHSMHRTTGDYICLIELGEHDIVARVVQADEVFAQPGTLTFTVTAEQSVIDSARKREDEAAWLSGHPGVLINTAGVRDPFVPDTLPQDS